MLNTTEIKQITSDLWQDSGIYVVFFLLAIIIVLLIVYYRSRKKTTTVKDIPSNAILPSTYASPPPHSHNNLQ